MSFKCTAKNKNCILKKKMRYICLKWDAIVFDIFFQIFPTSLFDIKMLKCLLYLTFFSLPIFFLTFFLSNLFYSVTHKNAKFQQVVVNLSFFMWMACLPYWPAACLPYHSQPACPTAASLPALLLPACLPYRCQPDCPTTASLPYLPQPACPNSLPAAAAPAYY